MKIKKNRKKNFCVEFTADEMDKFLNNCFKPLHKSSVNYFNELYRTLSKNVDNTENVENTEPKNKMKFCFLGDVHGDTDHCSKLAESHPETAIIQIGDLGVGSLPLDIFYRLPKNFYFFTGNHDCRKLSYMIPHCLGAYGEVFDKFFFVSGADSFFKDWQIQMGCWWPDEELTQLEAKDCLEKWKKSTVDVLVSHDIPQSFAEHYKLIYSKTVTRNLLQKMIEVRKPKLLITGHHHRSKDLVCNKIRWKELGINEPFFVEL